MKLGVICRRFYSKQLRETSKRSYLHHQLIKSHRKTSAWDNFALLRSPRNSIWMLTAVSCRNIVWHWKQISPVENQLTTNGFTVFKRFESVYYAFMYDKTTNGLKRQRKKHFVVGGEKQKHKLNKKCILIVQIELALINETFVRWELWLSWILQKAEVCVRPTELSSFSLRSREFSS